MIILSTFFIVYFMISKEIQHCRNIENAIRMIADIKSRSVFYSRPFSEIILELNNNKNYEKFTLIKVFCKYISEGISVPVAGGDSVEKNSKYFSAEECCLLTRFGEEMCRCNREEIAAISDNVIDEFQRFLQIATDRRNMKSKSTAAVTISAGLMIVLMFA